MTEKDKKTAKERASRWAAQEIRIIRKDERDGKPASAKKRAD